MEWSVMYSLFESRNENYYLFKGGLEKIKNVFVGGKKMKEFALHNQIHRLGVCLDLKVMFKRPPSSSLPLDFV